MKPSNDLGLKIAIWVAVAAIVASLAVLFVVPKPNSKSLQARRVRTEKDIRDNTVKARQDLNVAQAKVAAQTWTGGVEKVGPGALQAMNALATKHQVKLSGFRPQRTSQTAGLDLLPFSVTAEGSFLDVVAFVKGIEDPTNKLAVDTVQISSAQANSDQVTATVGITAYHVTEVPAHA